MGRSGATPLHFRARLRQVGEHVEMELVGAPAAMNIETAIGDLPADAVPESEDELSLLLMRGLAREDTPHAVPRRGQPAHQSRRITA